MTENQHAMPGRKSLLSLKQVPFGVLSKPMFSLATVTWAAGRPASSAFLLNANCCAPLKKPPPRPGVFSGKSS